MIGDRTTIMPNIMVIGMNENCRKQFDLLTDGIDLIETTTDFTANLFDEGGLKNATLHIFNETGEINFYSSEYSIGDAIRQKYIKCFWIANFGIWKEVGWNWKRG